MTNLALYANMIERYDRIAFTHNYIFGFTFGKNVYMTYRTADVLPLVCTLESASRGGGASLRFKPTKEQKELLLPGAWILCSVEYFEAEVKASKYNRGEIFEKIVTESFGQTWEKDRIPFTEAGDIEVDGIAYQIKYQKATFCSEKSLINLERG